MSFTQVPNIQDFIDRIVQTLKADLTLFPNETTGTNLVTNVIGTKPAIEQSPKDALLPIIEVFESGQPIRMLEKAGRDGRNEEGGSVYELEFYCLAITAQELNAEIAQKKIHDITQAIRSALSTNLRLADVTDSFSNPLCRTTTRFEINYSLRGDVPESMKARNVVVRPQVYVSPRG